METHSLKPKTENDMKLCDECRFTREPHEHKCYGGDCECPRCHPSKEELDAFRVKQDREEVKESEREKVIQLCLSGDGIKRDGRLNEIYHLLNQSPPEQKETQPQPVIFYNFLEEVYKGLREKKNRIDISLDLQKKYYIQRNKQ